MLSIWYMCCTNPKKGIKAFQFLFTFGKGEAKYYILFKKVREELKIYNFIYEVI